MKFASLETARERLRAGGMIVLVDDEHRENEGDLVAAAEMVTAETVNFMATHGRGWICLALDGEACRRLDLAPMVAENTARFGTAFTVTIEAREGVTTGISAADRAHTMRIAASADARASDLVRPGHVQPIRARPGGVLARAGQTEGSVDLCRLAELRPAGVICEIMNPDGAMARLPDLEKFCALHDLPLCSVAQIIEHRRRTEKLIGHAATARMPTRFGEFLLHAYRAEIGDESHYALATPDLLPGGPGVEEAVLARVHSECLTGDVFHSLRCDCGEQLQSAIEAVAREGRGVVVYMRQEGRGIGLDNKLRAYALQEKGLDTVEANERLGFAADLRDYGLGAQILADLGLRRLRLMTNNPRKLAGLSGHGLEIVERVSIAMPARDQNRAYLDAKRDKMGHLI